MDNWRASNARIRFSEIIDAAVAGRPQFVQRRDGKEVVVVSRDYYEKTKPNLKSFLLENGYSGTGEASFDETLREMRAHSPAFLTPSRVDQ
jgi:Antitoxin Phd_YefM, type II toxin-antitoxin system